MAGRGLDEGHVDLIDVGTFLAIDLDADKMVVEKSSDGGRLERFVLHDMAPMAGRVTDGEENRLVLGLRLGERLLAPREPINGIVRVLKEIRRFFLTKTIRR